MNCRILEFQTGVAAIALVLCAIPGSGHAQSVESADSRRFTVKHYDVQLEPRLDSRIIIGTVTLSVVPLGDAAETEPPPFEVVNGHCL